MRGLDLESESITVLDNKTAEIHGEKKAKLAAEVRYNSIWILLSQLYTYHSQNYGREITGIKKAKPQIGQVHR